MLFETERRTYYLKLNDLMLANEDALRKWAVVSGKEIIGTFKSFEEAKKAGTAKKGNTPFLIVRITKGYYPPSAISGKMDIKGIKRRATYVDLKTNEEDKNVPDKEFPYHAKFID